MIIDFGADPPFFTPLTGEYNIEKLVEKDTNEIIIEYSWRNEEAVERFWNLIMLFDDGTIQFRPYGDRSYFASISHIYYRTYGPELNTYDK